MTRQKITACLIASAVLQAGFLVGMVAKAAMPLWIGTEIRVKTIPVDPRSMFRGNYAQLRYKFGSLMESELQEAENLRHGEIVYVKLQPGESDLYEFSGASLNLPTTGIFLRGRIVNTSPPYLVAYGIEAYFAPKERALKLEKDLREGGIAVLMVTDRGQAALKTVIPHRQ